MARASCLAIRSFCWIFFERLSLVSQSMMASQSAMRRPVEQPQVVQKIRVPNFFSGIIGEHGKLVAMTFNEGKTSAKRTGF